MYAQADRVPDRARYLRLSYAYARRLLALHREWIGDIEAALANGDDTPNVPPNSGTGA